MGGRVVYISRRIYYLYLGSKQLSCLMPTTLPGLLIYLTRGLLLVALGIGLWRFRQLPASLRYLTGLVFFYVLIESAAAAIFILKSLTCF